MATDIADNLTVILTACIDPKGMPGVSRPDPKVREQDYQACLLYYLKNFPRIRRIVFVENSGWPLDDLKSICRSPTKELEFVSLAANDYPRHRGKGYGEMMMLDHAMAVSELAHSSRYVAKLTGRNYLRNMETLLDRVSRPFELLCDLRDHPFYELAGSNWCGRHCDTRFFVYTPSFYAQNLKGTYEQLSETYIVEKLVYDIAKRAELRGVVVPRFPIEPDYAGVSGHLLPDGTARDYSSKSEVLRRKVRSVARILTPWLHI